MSLLPYKSSAWASFRQTKVEIDFPLAEEEPTHFTLARTFVGPREAFTPQDLNTVDDFFSGTSINLTGTASTDRITLASLNSPYLMTTGLPVVLATVVSGLAGLTAGTTYYLTRVSDLVFTLATTRANAIAGTAINITSDGSGTLTLPIAYLVRPGALRSLDGGDVEFTRLYATLPAQWSDAQTFPYEFPAIAATTIGTARTYTALAASGSNFVFSSGSGDASLVGGDSCFVSTKFTRGGLVYQWSGYTRATASSTGTTATIGGVFAAFGTGSFSSVTATVVKAATARDAPETFAVPTRLVSDYALSTATAVATDLPLAQPFSPVVTSTAVKTAYLTASTTPTSAEYAALVAAGTEIVVEPPRHQRYLGNIWCRVTRLAAAR